jgi:hypothetical protein
MNGESRQPRNRRQIWLLIGLFFAPLAAAFILYYGIDGWRPPGSTNHGDLVTPPRPLPEIALPTPQNSAVAANFLRGKWTLFYVGDGQCDARCREALTLIRQTRLALNDDLIRVQRVFVATEHCCDQAYLDQEHAGLIVVRAQDTAEFLEPFPEYDGVPAGRSGRIYIADPLGNLMMSYAPAAKPKGLLEDLKKLLKLSHIG